MFANAFCCSPTKSIYGGRNAERRVQRWDKVCHMILRLLWQLLPAVSFKKVRQKRHQDRTSCRNRENRSEPELILDVSLTRIWFRVNLITVWTALRGITVTEREIWAVIQMHCRGHSQVKLYLCLLNRILSSQSLKPLNSSCLLPYVLYHHSEQTQYDTCM